MVIGGLGIRSLILFLFLVIRSSSQLAPDHPMTIFPGCPDSCGGVTVPYPFGLTRDCTYQNSTGFLLSCNTTSSGDPPQLLWGNISVLDINAPQGEMTLSLFVSYSCFRRSGGMQLPNESITSRFSFLQDSPFTISPKNKLTIIGCDTMGFLRGSWGKDFTNGCVSYCQDLNSVDGANSTSCDGVGCCQTAVPKGTRWAEISVYSIYNYTKLLSQSPANNLACGYAFLVREDNFTFHRSYLVRDNFLKNRPRTPVLVEWAIGGQNDTCKGMANPCPAQHSECVSSTAATGYQCKCKDGFQGNPYLLNGCADIDECKKLDRQPCGFKLTCINTIGDYECRCSDNKTVILDRGKEGYNCPTDDQKQRSIPLYQRLIAACLSGAFLLIGVGRLCYRYKIAYAIKTTNFSRNGGLKLLQRIKSLDKDGINVRDLIRFKEKKLVKSMNKDNIVSDPKDAHMGKAYKGRLRNEKVVIKEVHLEEKEEKDVEEFVDRVVDLYKTKDHNILQLLGYCFETKAPLLVYKFNPICWRAEYADFYSLLKTAEKTADWFVNFPPYMAVRLTTIVQETLDFLPTGYFKETTDTSDVFCFGVVMTVLFTEEKPWSQHGSRKNTVNHDLTTHCISLLNKSLNNKKRQEGNDAGSGIVDIHELIVELVKRCFQEDGERPILTMEQVLDELRNINPRTTTASMG